MSKVSAHYLYLLTRANLGSGLGWYLLHEILAKSSEEQLHYVVPVSRNQRPFRSYWVQTATYLGKGEFSKHLGCFPMVYKEGRFILQHDIAEITFVVKRQLPQYFHLKYLGRYNHEAPDFHLELVEIVLVKSEVTEILFRDAKQVIINPDFVSPT
jgi:hypothetical protein